MNIIKRIICQLFHRNHHENYWSEFSKYFFRCHKCQRHFSRKRPFPSPYTYQMNILENRICTFAKNPDKITEAYAIVAVGRDKGDSAEVIMAHLIAHILLAFHGIPTTPQTGN